MKTQLTNVVSELMIVWNELATVPLATSVRPEDYRSLLFGKDRGDLNARESEREVSPRIPGAPP